MNQPAGKCPVCGSDIEYIQSLYDDRYAYPGQYSLLRCLDCGHSFLKGDFSPEMLRDLYSRYYPRSTFELDNYRPYREMHGFIAWLEGAKSSPFRWVPRDVRVLDIGCGFGESLGYHQSRGCEVQGVEADENIRRVAEKFGYKVHVGLFDAAIYEPDYFDFVTMSQVIEHVVDPVKTLKGIERILKPGAVAVLSTPNASGWGAKLFGKYWINWHTPYHLQFFSIHSMQLAAEQAGLVLEKVETITPSAWLYFQWIHLLSFPQEKNTSVFWTPGGHWSFLQKVTLKFLAIIHLCKINHVITRLFDVMGVGDNHLYFLRKSKK